MKVRLINFLKNLEFYIFFQSVAFFFALPYIVFYGFSVSTLAILGNFFFGPILIILIFLFSIIFCLQTLGVKSSLFIYLANLAANFFINILDLASKNCCFFISTKKFLIFILIFSYLFFHFKKKLLFSFHRTTIILFFLANLFFFLDFQFIPLSDGIYKTLKKRSGFFQIELKNNNAYLHDHKYLSQFSNYESVIDFNIVPEIAKSIGTSKIKELFIKRVNSKNISSIKRLCQKLSIEKVCCAQDIKNLLPSVSKKIL